MTRSIALALLAVSGGTALAQEGPVQNANVEVLSHLPMKSAFEFSHTDIEIEQELSRPYAYVGRIVAPTMGFDIIDLSNPAKAKIIYEWRIENAELHVGLGGMDNKYFKLNGRYYLVQSFQFAPGGPDADLGAIVFDVTGLPDVSTVREVGRIRAPDTPGGFHNIFAYKHSSGRVLLVTTTSGAHGNIYDMEKFLAKDPSQGLIGQVPWPVNAPIQTSFGPLAGYHDYYVAQDPASGQDKLYGAGFNGYYIYDITRPESPSLITSVVGVFGLDLAHTVSASPDGKIAVGQTEYLYSPVRVYDLEPGLSGKVPTINQEIGVWSANWKGMSHNHEMRWPYVFVSHYAEGLQVFDLTDPTSPKTVASFQTHDGPPRRGLDPREPTLIGDAGFTGAFGVDVRNADGLVVVSDFGSGFWAFKVKDFDGWDGKKFGVANISSAQDWDRGPKPVP
ncbi:MAG: hypothetical protein R2909_09600 [Gemmatimonadales bacterium]